MAVHNNFYSCYYNNDPNKMIRTDLYDRWDVYFNVIDKQKPMSFKKEVLRSCELIYDLLKPYTPKLNFFFSGGIDSEAVLRCFHELKIPVNPIIIEHFHYPNGVERKVSEHTCNSLGLEPTIIDINLLELFKKNVLQDIGEKYHTPHLQIIELLHVFELVNQPCIIADDIQLTKTSYGNEYFAKDETVNQKWYYELKEDVDGPFDRYEYMTGMPVICDTLKYTPESWIAMLTNNTIKSIVKPFSGKASSASSKNIMMSREFNVFWRSKVSLFGDGPYRRINNILLHDLEYQLFPIIRRKLEYYDLLNTLGYKDES